MQPDRVGRKLGWLRLNLDRLGDVNQPGLEMLPCNLTGLAAVRLALFNPAGLGSTWVG